MKFGVLSSLGNLVLLGALATATPSFAEGQSSAVLSFGAAQLTYDTSKWVAQEDGSAGTWKLTNKKGDAYANFTVERFQIPLNTVIDVALERMRSGYGTVTMVNQENRIIGGVPVRVIRYNATPKGIPVTLLTCYYGGKLGAVQLVAYTGRQLFDEYQADFEELFNGLSIAHDDSPAATQSKSAEEQNGPDKTLPAPNPPPPAVFILSNGERLESSNYLLTADSVRVQQGEAQRTIPLSALNLQATIAANRARGLYLMIPTSRNQIELSF